MQITLFVGADKTLSYLRDVFVQHLFEITVDLQFVLGHIKSLKNADTLEALVRESLPPVSSPESLKDIFESAGDVADMAAGYVNDAKEEKEALAAEVSGILKILDLIVEEDLRGVSQALRERASALHNRAERLGGIIDMAPPRIDKERQYVRAGVPQYRAEAVILNQFADLLLMDSPSW